MSCTLSFLLHGHSYKIDGIPLDQVELLQKEGKINGEITIDELLKAIETLEVLDPVISLHEELIKVIRDYQKKTMGHTEGSAFKEDWGNEPLPLHLLVNNDIKPNRTNSQLIGLLQYEDHPLAVFIRNRLAMSDRDFVSFVSREISIDTINSVPGFFDKKTNKAYVNMTDDTITDPTNLALLAHEIIHGSLNSEIYNTPGFAQNIIGIYNAIKEASKKASPDVQARFKIIDSKTGNLQAEEILAYFLTDPVLRDHLKTLSLGEPTIISLFNSVLDLENPELMEAIFDQYANDSDNSLIEMETSAQDNYFAAEIEFDRQKFNAAQYADQRVITDKSNLLTLGAIGHEITITYLNANGIQTRNGAILDQTTYLDLSSKPPVKVALSSIVGSLVKLQDTWYSPEDLRNLTDQEEFAYQEIPQEIEEDMNDPLVKIAPSEKGFTREYWVERATKVREHFKYNTDAKFNRFDISYSKRVDMREETYSMQALRLEEHDLVLVPVNLRWDKKQKDFGYINKKETQDHSSYRPVMYTFIKDGQVWVTIAASELGNSYTIRAEEILGYRKYEGELINPEPSQATIDLLHAELIDEYDEADDEDADSILLKFTKNIKVAGEDEDGPGKDVEMYRPSNNRSVGFICAHGSAIQDLFDGIVPRDTVRAQFPGGNKFRGKVARKLGNLLEIVTTQGKLVTVTIEDLVEIIYLDENHEESFGLIKNELARDLYSRNDEEDEELLLTDDEILQVIEERNERNKENPNEPKTFRNDFKRRYMEVNGQMLEYYRFPAKNKYTQEYKEVLQRRRNLISNLKPRSLVKVNWNSTLIESKRLGLKHVPSSKDKISSGWYPVIGKTTDTVYFYTKTLGVQHVNIRADYGANSSLGGIAYNNVREARIFDHWMDMRERWRGIFEDEDGRKLSSAEIRANMSAAAKSKDVTRLRDFYYLTEFDPELNDNPDSYDDLQTAISRIAPGDVVKQIITLANKKEITKWFIVTDVNEFGEPVCVAFFDEFDRAYGDNQTYTVAASYSVRPISIDSIIAVGTNVVAIPHLGIKGNPHILAKIEQLDNKLTDFKTPKFFSKEDLLTTKLVSRGTLEKSAFLTSADLKKAKAPKETYSDRTVEKAFYGKRKGENAWGASANFFDDPESAKQVGPRGEVRYFVQEENGAFISEGKFRYENVWYAGEVEGNILHDTLKIGDMVTEKWEYQGKWYWADGIIIKKNQGGLVVRRMVYDEDSDSMVFTTKSIYRKFSKTGDTIPEYPGLSSVFLAKEGRGIDNAKDDRLTLTANRPGSSTYMTDTKAKRVLSRKKKTGAQTVRGRERSVDMDGFNKSKDSKDKICQVANMLKYMYDLDIKLLTTEEIANQFDKILEGTPSNDRAFSYNGKIYVNVDRASSAEPIHELGHIIFKSLQKTNPELVNKITYTVKNHPDYALIAENYPGRTQQDVDIEVFVTLFGEHYRTEMHKNDTINKWNQENSGFFSNIVNGIKNLFSSVFGNKAIKSLSNTDFINMSLDDVFNLFGEHLITGRFKHAVSQYTNSINAKVQSLKEKLMSEDKLTTLCYN